MSDLKVFEKKTASKVSKYSKWIINGKSHFYEKGKLIFTCSKLTIKTLEQGVKYVQG